MMRNCKVDYIRKICMPDWYWHIAVPFSILIFYEECRYRDAYIYILAADLCNKIKRPADFAYNKFIAIDARLSFTD